MKYAQVYDKDKRRYVLVPRETRTPKHHLIMPDMADYTSPIDGALVSGRKQRREDLKKNGCRAYEPGEREERQRHLAAEDRDLDRCLVKTMQEVANG